MQLRGCEQQRGCQERPDTKQSIGQCPVGSRRCIFDGGQPVVGHGNSPTLLNDPNSLRQSQGRGGVSDPADKVVLGIQKRCRRERPL